MNIDRGSFFMILSTLAAGGAVGYVAAEKRVFPVVDTWVGRIPEPTAAPPAHVATAVVSAPPAVTVPPPPPPPAAPACDDSVATSIGECPGPGLPTIEGGCGNFASVRCGELKQSLKPRVASVALDCIGKLSPKDRCDPARVHLCGHLALMNACPDVAPAAARTDAGAVDTPVTTICHGIIESCGASSVAPSMTECRQLLSGMNDAGRDRTRACMKAHCFDRGLVGCEAAAATAAK